MAGRVVMPKLTDTMEEGVVVEKREGDSVRDRRALDGVPAAPLLTELKRILEHSKGLLDGGATA